MGERSGPAWMHRRSIRIIRRTTDPIPVTDKARRAGKDNISDQFGAEWVEAYRIRLDAHRGES